MTYLKSAKPLRKSQNIVAGQRTYSISKPKSADFTRRINSAADTCVPFCFSNSRDASLYGYVPLNPIRSDMAVYGCISTVPK